MLLEAITRGPSPSPNVERSQHAASWRFGGSSVLAWYSMQLTNLADLDELVLQVRHQPTRTYVGEAVLAYRAGAYRAALVGLWVAVAYDLVAKLRELAALGDTNAIKKVEDLDRWIA